MLAVEGRITSSNRSNLTLKIPGRVVAGCEPRKALEQWRGELNLADNALQQQREARGAKRRAAWARCALANQIYLC